MEFAPFLLVGLAAVGLAWWQYHRKAARREALFVLAQRHRLTYHRADVLGLSSLPFRFLRRGDDRGVENVVTGELDGEQVRLFDLWVMFESTDAKGNRSRRYERYSCAHLEIPVPTSRAWSCAQRRSAPGCGIWSTATCSSNRRTSTGGGTCAATIAASRTRSWIRA